MTRDFAERERVQVGVVRFRHEQVRLEREEVRREEAPCPIPQVNLFISRTLDLRIRYFKFSYRQ